jgi:hypothetical protein
MYILFAQRILVDIRYILVGKFHVDYMCMLFSLLVLGSFCCVDGHIIIQHSETQQDVYNKDSNN